jgi:hypothetical protein
MFSLPERLQIVKPIEGSQTLQHWQHLATPNLGCLFESRPGISIKGGQDDIVVNNKKDALTSIIDLDSDYEDDDGIDDRYDYDEDIDDEFMNELERNFYDPSEQQPLMDTEPANLRVLTPSKVELLSRLLSNEEASTAASDPAVNSDSQPDSLSNSAGSFMGFIKNISTRYFRSVSTNDESQARKQAVNKVRKSPKKNRECDDPDTPPSSPINLPGSHTDLKFQLMDVLESAKNKCITLGSFLKLAPTPPGTPFNERADCVEESSSSSEDETTEGSVFDNMQSFFDQIVNRLGVFSFRTVNTTQPVIGSEQELVKPSPVYFDSNYEELKSKLENVGRFNEEDDAEMVEIERRKEEEEAVTAAAAGVKCSTPPPSPSKFSPPLPDMNAEAYTEEEMRKSAFVKVATLNPLINKSMSIDLNSLLGSLSTLRRNQRVEQ